MYIFKLYVTEKVKKQEKITNNFLQTFAQDVKSPISRDFCEH